MIKRLALLLVLLTAAAAPALAGRNSVINVPDTQLDMRLHDGQRTSNIAFSGFDSLKVAADTQEFEEGFATGLDLIETWDLTTVAGGTITVEDSQGIFSTFADGDLVQIRTKSPHQFLHGFSNTWRMRVITGDAGGIAGSIREWGVFNSTDGYFFRLDADGMKVVIRRKTIETVISSSSFNNAATFTYTGTGHSYAIQYLDGNRVVFYIDNELVFQKGSQVANLVAESQLPTTVRNEQLGVTSSTRTILITGLAVIRDGAPFTFDSAGRVRVSGGVAEAPAGTDAVVQPVIQRITIGNNQTVDEFYTITSGKALTIQVFDASAESAGTRKSVIFTLYEDPTGTGTPLITLKTIMGNNLNEERIIDQTFIGDGIRRILLRSEQIGGAQMIISRMWQGFEQ